MAYDIPHHITDEESRWLEEVRNPEPVKSPCCSKCRRGIVPGQFPCGYHGACPNDCHQRKDR